jgi:hypothetical protein
MSRSREAPSRKKGEADRPRRKSSGRSSSSTLDDGGARSLAGYIYQMIGSASERVILADAPSESALETSARFFVEQHGQDAVSTNVSGVRLIQFKYSQDARPLKPVELADILLALEKSSKHVRQTTAVHWRLVTNRPLSAMARRSHGAAKRTKGPRTRRSVSTGSESPSRVIARLGARLEIVRKNLNQFKASLLDAANRFGVDDDGIAGRVMTLLFEVATKPPNRREVSLEALNRQLAGYSKPKSIRLKDCGEELRAALAAAVGPGGEGGIVLTEAVERRGFETLLAERAALAVVHGPGGCGKTISLFKALDRRLSDGVGPAGMIVDGPRALGHVIDSWRNAPPTGAAPAEALRRLRVANADLGRPVLVLGLDGLDEVSEPERAEAEALIRHFYSMHVELHRSRIEPDGLLIVTCRNRDDLDYVVGPRGTGGLPPPDIPAIDVGEFTDEEFGAVWDLWFPDEVVPRLGLSDEMRATVADAVDEVTTQDQRLLALRHPVLLGCTKLLSPEERQLLYRGDAGVWGQVLASYFDWFTRKAGIRAGCHRRKVLGVLKAAARATVATPLRTCDREDDWVTPATTDTGQAPELVRQIFDDAVTAGVVIAGPNKYTQPVRLPIEWRWRFSELATHLASLA